MKDIKESTNDARWPRMAVKSVECRRRDLVFRITDWSRDKDEPAYDVEAYIGGVYDYNESKCCSVYEFGTLAKAKAAAIAFVQRQTAKLL